ncbi:MAG: biotin synthase BioB [Desulfobacterales bacterium]|nr:biotin synthase BioB [Desulfobacterales bacterium]
MHLSDRTSASTVLSITEKILHNAGESASLEEAKILAAIPDEDIIDLLAGAHKITSPFKKKDDIFTCTILNAKSGRCSQDCAFCAQSGHHHTGIPVYPLLSRKEMVRNALDMEKIGATNFSMVTSGYRLNDDEIDIICDAAAEILLKTRLTACCSLGMLTRDQAKRLHQSGITNYHHNLETAESHFDQICTTHAYAEDIDTLKIAAEAGLSVCSGCIFGLGESWEQRVELGFALRGLNVPRIPINFLNPIPGTKLQHMPLLSPFDALKCIALMRFIHPHTDIIICGGREPALKDYQSWIFMAGANGLMIGNYLTTKGRNLQMDLEMIDCWNRLLRH